MLQRFLTLKFNSISFREALRPVCDNLLKTLRAYTHKSLLRTETAFDAVGRDDKIENGMRTGFNGEKDVKETKKRRTKTEEEMIEFANKSGSASE